MMLSVLLDLARMQGLGRELLHKPMSAQEAEGSKKAYSVRTRAQRSL